MCRHLIIAGEGEKELIALLARQAYVSNADVRIRLTIDIGVTFTSLQASLPL